MSAAFDNDALATLTPEEIEAINSDDMDPGERAALQRIADGADADADDADDTDDGDDDADDDEAGDDAGQDPADDAAAPPVEGATPAAAAAAAEPVAASGEVHQADVVYKADLPPDFDAKVADLATREAELKDRFKAGDIDIDEYDDEKSKLFAEREELNAAKLKAEVASEMTAQAAERQWQRAIDTLVASAAKPENGGVDYKADAVKAADLDTFVRTLAARPENADKSMEWFLGEAHKRVLALHGIAGEQKPAARDAAKSKPAADDRRPPVDAVPKSIAGVPGGDGPGDVRGEFSHLDSLEGDALEAALDRMTPDQRARYAAGA